jgi:proteic killer suppression protein
MIRSFGDRRTEALFRDQFVRDFQGFARSAKRKLEAINAASRLSDLSVSPSNRLEKLRGALEEFYSVRINDQWRVIFRWSDAEPHEVQIVDYH